MIGINWSSIDWTPFVELGMIAVSLFGLWALTKFGKKNHEEAKLNKVASNHQIGMDFIRANDIQRLQDVSVDIVKEFMSAAGIKNSVVAERVLKSLIVGLIPTEK